MMKNILIWESGNVGGEWKYVVYILNTLTFETSLRQPSGISRREIYILESMVLD